MNKYVLVENKETIKVLDEISACFKKLSLDDQIGCSHMFYERILIHEFLKFRKTNTRVDTETARKLLDDALDKTMEIRTQLFTELKD